MIICVLLKRSDFKGTQDECYTGEVFLKRFPFKWVKKKIMVSKGMTLFSVQFYFCLNVSTDLSFNSFVLVFILNNYVQRSLAYRYYYIYVCIFLNTNH